MTVESENRDGAGGLIRRRFQLRQFLAIVFQERRAVLLLGIVGRSMAGEETFIALPEFSVAFDVGRAPREVVHAEHVFLTHGHIDHSAGIAYYFSQRWFLDNAPGNLPVNSADDSLVEAAVDFAQ